MLNHKISTIKNLSLLYGLCIILYAFEIEINYFSLHIHKFNNVRKITNITNCNCNCSKLLLFYVFS